MAGRCFDLQSQNAEVKWLGYAQVANLRGLQKRGALTLNEARSNKGQV